MGCNSSSVKKQSEIELKDVLLLHSIKESKDMDCVKEVEEVQDIENENVEELITQSKMPLTSDPETSIVEMVAISINLSLTRNVDQELTPPITKSFRSRLMYKPPTIEIPNCPFPSTENKDLPSDSPLESSCTTNSSISLNETLNQEDDLVNSPKQQIRVVKDFNLSLDDFLFEIPIS